MFSFSLNPAVIIARFHPWQAQSRPIPPALAFEAEGADFRRLS